MDFLDYSSEENSRKGMRMDLLVPGTQQPATHQAKGDTEPRQMYITLLGPESPVTKRFMRQIAQRGQGKNGKRVHSPSDDDLEAERIADAKGLASMTVDGLIFFDKQWIELNADNAFVVYDKVLAARAQALDFVFDFTNFTKAA